MSIPEAPFPLCVVNQETAGMFPVLRAMMYTLCSCLHPLVNRISVP